MNIELSKVRMLGNKVAIVPILEGEEKSESGIILDKAALEVPKTAIVIAIGPECEHVAPGDTIQFPSGVCVPFCKIEGRDTLMVTEDKIGLIIASASETE